MKVLVISIFLVFKVSGEVLYDPTAWKPRVERLHLPSKVNVPIPHSVYGPPSTKTSITKLENDETGTENFNKKILNSYGFPEIYVSPSENQGQKMDIFGSLDQTSYSYLPSSNTENVDGLSQGNCDHSTTKYGPPQDNYGPPRDSYGIPQESFNPTENNYGAPENKQESFLKIESSNDNSKKKSGNGYKTQENVQNTSENSKYPSIRSNEFKNSQFPLDLGAVEKLMQSFFIQHLPHFEPAKFRSIVQKLPNLKPSKFMTMVQKLPNFDPSKFIAMVQKLPSFVPSKFTTIEKNQALKNEPSSTGKKMPTVYRTISLEDYRRYPAVIRKNNS